MSLYVLCATSRNDCRPIGCNLGQVISIDVLPDDVLLVIFDIYMDQALNIISEALLRKKLVEGWQPLVHVCRRWRSVVFGSPRHLNLRLGCSFKTPVRDKLDIWPASPLIIYDDGRDRMDGVGNITAALERNDRVYQIALSLTSSQLERVSAAMQPFPELTHLVLGVRIKEWWRSFPIRSWVDRS
jgi:hypothetical protein